jgi:FemAB-related protein (PEP-CTERM system-associated)
MNIESISDSEGNAWDEYVFSSPKASFYHQYLWRRVIEEPYGLRTHYLTAKENGRIHGVLPLAEVRSVSGTRSLVSLPYSNYAGVISDSREAEHALIEEARKLLEERHLSHLELKQEVACDDDRLEENLGYHALGLPLVADPEEIWKTQLNTKARNQVRKARKRGVSVEIGREHFLDFVTVYRRNLRDLGTPTHSMRWFKMVDELFGERTTSVVARVEGKPVAGGWILFFRDTAIMQAGASIQKFLPLCPNNLVYWSAIEHVCRQGCTFFDFARSRVGAGTYHFKQQWGAEPRQTHYQYLLNTAKEVEHMDPHSPKFKAATACWKLLPLPVANAVGPFLRRGIST